jgi:hypothetical protein
VAQLWRVDLQDCHVLILRHNRDLLVSSTNFEEPWIFDPGLIRFRAHLATRAQGSTLDGETIDAALCAAESRFNFHIVSYHFAAKLAKLKT